MAKRTDALTRMRAICLSLPDTRETLTWGAPHFRVGDKIFAGYGEEHGHPAIGFKLEMEHAAELVRGGRFTRAPYVGHKGWVSVEPAQVADWDEIAALILESYRLIAPRRSFAKLEASLTLSIAPEAPAARKTRAAKAASRAKSAGASRAKAAAASRTKARSKSGTKPRRRSR